MVHAIFVAILMTCLWESVKPMDNVDPKKLVEGTELLLTYLVHRHGDKMPDVHSIPYEFNKPALAEFHDTYGYGELTNRGKRRAYHLGQYLRWRYNELLSWEYNATEIYIYSTDIPRTQMTVLTAMSAVYPPIRRWSETINWVPTPYTTRPLKDDPNMAIVDCPTYKEYSVDILTKPSSKLDCYKPLLQKINKIYGENFEFVPNTFLLLFDTLLSEMYLGIDLGMEIISLMPELRKAQAAVLDLLFESEEAIRAVSGYMLSEFFRVAEGVVNGTISQKVWIHSVHDINVYGMEKACLVESQRGPRFCSSFALELRRDCATGQLLVLPVYLPGPEEPERFLQVDGCDGLLCDYGQFQNLTANHVMTEDEWNDYCQCPPDFVVTCDSLW